MDCVFCTGNQPISSSHMSFFTPPWDLNGDSFFWLHVLKLTMLAGGQHASQSTTAFCRGPICWEALGGKCLCLHWLSPALQFNRLDLFQTSRPTNPADTQGEGKWREKMIRKERMIFCLLFQRRHEWVTAPRLGSGIEFWKKVQKGSVWAAGRVQVQETWEEVDIWANISTKLHLQIQNTAAQRKESFINKISLISTWFSTQI